jgi:hypothetical protein
MCGLHGVGSTAAVCHVSGFGERYINGAATGSCDSGTSMVLCSRGYCVHIDTLY